MKSFIKHIRVYFALTRFSISRSMEFRVDFFFRFLMDCFFYAISIAFFEVIFLHTETLAGWERRQVLLFISGALLIDGLFMTFIARSTWELPRLINKGDLDFQLLRPVNSLFFVLSRHFELASLLNVLLALGIMSYSLSLFSELPSLLHFLGYILLLINGLALTVILRMFTVLPVFWTHSEFGFHMLYMSFEQVTERPEVIFRGFAHVLFTAILPFLVITSFPASWFFGELSLLGFAYAFLITAVFFYIMITVWRAGLRVYSSASS